MEHDNSLADLGLQPETTDVAQITDVQVLKAMAYDQMVVMETCQQNLRVLTERISQLSVTVPITNGAEPIAH
jgi:hypothetical protein